MDVILYLAIVVSMLATLITARKWIRKAPMIGIMGWDMNKPGLPKVAEMGGICVVFGFVIGMLAYIGIQTFFFGSSNYISMLAVLCTVLMTCIIGMMDDILGWKVGLKQWQKPIFTLFAALPIMVINAGQSTMVLPLVGRIDWGIIYPLLIVPIGIVGASNAYNMVAGFNGLETGMGIIILSALGYTALINGKSSALALSVCMLGALVVFLYFNWYPAKVFPGDTMTYSLGALIACVAIVGDMEKIAMVLFVPYAIDFLLQFRSGFKSEAFAKVDEDGSLQKPDKGIYHLTHLAIAMLKKIKPKVNEKDVVLFLFVVEIAISGFAIRGNL
jgi:UDP-N-acetylglucosamine--dolichyl-phosphate N-acetylglucosaminephosphotransferase